MADNNIINGVDVTELFNTIEAIKGKPDIREVQVSCDQQMDQRYPLSCNDQKSLWRFKGG